MTLAHAQNQLPAIEAYGLPPGAHGYRLADLVCTPGRRDPWVAEGAYSQSAVALVASGVFEYRSEGSALTAVPGALLFANNKAAFACQHLCADGNRRRVLFFSRALLEEVASDLALDDARFPASAAPPSHLTPLMASFLQRVARGNAESDEAAFAIAATALRSSCGGASRDEPSAAERRRIVAAVRYINAHFASACTLETLAEVAGMSRFRFARRFRAVTGETAAQYVLNRRLSAAAEMLLATQRTVSEIAYEAGFNDLSYFYARFKAVFGRAPGAWRRLQGA